MPGETTTHRVGVAALLLTLALLFSGVALGASAGPTHAASAPLAPPQLSTPTGTYFDYVVIILMENHAICQIYTPCGGAGPYETSLANTYGLAKRYVDCGAPSLPNYLCLSGGTTFGCDGYDGYPNSNTCTGIAWKSQNIVDRLVTANLSWKGYAENMPSDCYGANSGSYYVRHFPFPYYNDIVNNATRKARCVPAGTNDATLLGDLGSTSTASNYMWFTPNGCNDMHDCSVATGDTYLKGLVPKILNSTVFKTTRAALFITFDEDSGGSGHPNLYTVWAGPTVKLNYTSTASYNHFSLLKTLEVNWGLTNLTANDKNAASMGEFFGSNAPDFSLSANPTSVSFVAGASANSTISLHPTGGFNGNVSLSASSSPAGVTTSCVPSSINGTTTSKCTMTSTTPGSYSVKITGTSGTLVHNVTISVTVTSNAPDFSLSASPTSVSFIVGQSGSSTISLHAVNGFTGTVGLTATSSPVGVTASCVPSSISGTTTSKCTMNSTTAGSFIVTVKGTSGALVHTVTISVTVTMAPVAPSVVTNAATAIAKTAASLNGNLTALGTATSVSVGFLYGTSSSLTSATNTTVATKTAPGTFAKAVTGLATNTTYYVKAWAKGQLFSAGAIVSFRTLANSSVTPNPTSAMKAGGTPGSNGWYTSTVTVTLSVADPSGSAVWAEYRVDLGSWVNYTSAFVLSDGRHTVEYYAADAYGAAPEAHHTASINVDATPPMISGVLPTGIVTTSTVTFLWNASDQVSGIAAYNVQVDGGTVYSLGLQTKAMLTLADGPHTVEVRATDVAGNSVVQTTAIRVDTNILSPSGPYGTIPLMSLFVLLIAGSAGAYASHRHRKNKRMARARALRAIRHTRE